jgi:hypothetical protein
MDDLSPSNLTESGITMPSDSENYNHDSPSPASSSSPLILYKPPTLWGLVRGAAINLLLPFVNGLMLGFGELVANEMAFRLGWSGTKVCQCKESELGARANSHGRFSRCIGVSRGGLGRGWRCVRIRLKGEGGMGRSWICILRWSRVGCERRNYQRKESVYISWERDSTCTCKLGVGPSRRVYTSIFVQEDLMPTIAS